MNEARLYTRSNLTPQQKREAEAAVFGLQESPQVSNQLSSAEVERMRTMIAQHDAAQTTQEFDLAKPPVKPYVHQEFPKIIYHQDGRHRVVESERELQHWLSNGWSRLPVMAQVESDDPEMLPESEEEAAEIARIDAQLTKRGPGRPKKSQE